MAQQGVLYGRYVVAEDVYERSKAAREARIKAQFQQLEQHLSDAFVTLADQVAALTVGGNLSRRRLVIPQ